MICVDMPANPSPEDRARHFQRTERVNWMVDLWQRDRVGFDLFAPGFVQEDPFLKSFLPKDAAARVDELLRRK